MTDSPNPTQTDPSQPTKSPKAREPARHAYDAPMLSAREFLFAVMHDPAVPLVTRMDAAAKLMRIMPPEPIISPRVSAIAGYRIEGFTMQ
jgi:hypothetical protein